MKRYDVTAIFTCFNRKKNSVDCVKSLTNGNPKINFHFIVVDDNSTDGTANALRALSNVDIHIIEGTGSLFWCGGMRTGLAEFLGSNVTDNGYCLFVNDDVLFYEHAIEKMFERLAERQDYVVVGATCNDKGQFTYGLKCREKWYKKNITRRIYPSKEEIFGETFNANAVLLPNSVVKNAGNMDPIYTHSLGDYDYGFRLSNSGIHLISSSDYVGICNGNSSKGTWNDRELSRKERLKKKESPKGNPAKEWWHFIYKNWGVMSAIKYSIIPYVKILLGR